MSCNTILDENLNYWTHRASGYSAVNQEELGTRQREVWRSALCEKIFRHFSDRAPSDLRVLEVGTGPGFFAIILAESGFDVTAIDLTPNMLSEAKKNAGQLADSIHFMEMNAESLTFAEESFDVVISRNLTWNLPHPEEAYREWARVLKPGGLLLNFDANWYGYLFDADAQAAYDADRQHTAALGFEDQNIGENFDVMEDIARRVPLSNILRPAWDINVLTSLGLTVSVDTEIWRRVWSEQEKLNFASTPMFLVEASRPSSPE